MTTEKEIKNLQKKLSPLEQHLKRLPLFKWRKDHKKLLDDFKEAVRSCAKEIQLQTDIDYWQKFLYNTFGNRRIADVQDEDTLVIALTKEAEKTMKLLVDSSPSGKRLKCGCYVETSKDTVRTDLCPECLKRKREKQDEKFRQSGYEKHAKSASAELDK